jgi:hypothetical protein
MFIRIAKPHLFACFFVQRTETCCVTPMLHIEIPQQKSIWAIYKLVIGTIEYERLFHVGINITTVRKAQELA